MVGIAQGLIGSFAAAGEAAATLPVGTLLIFDRASTGTPLPSGWTAFTSFDGSPVEGYAIKASSTVARNLETAGEFRIDSPAPRSTDAGTSSHNYSTTAAGPGPGPGAQTFGTTYRMGPGTNLTPAGAHSHTLPSGNRGPFKLATVAPDTAVIGGMVVPLITNAAAEGQVPANAVIFCGTTSVFSGFSRKTWPSLAPFTSIPESVGLYSIAPAASHVVAGQQTPSGSTLTTPAGAPLTSASIFGPAAGTGAHFHGPGALGYGPGPFPAPASRLAWSTGFHTHTEASITASFVKYWKQFTHITPVVSATDQDVTSGMIVMYTSSTIPDGWYLCDGTNGTPNLVDQFIGFNNASPSTTTPLVIGQDQLGMSSPGPDAPSSTGFFITTPGPSDVRSGNWSVPYSPTPWPHSHPGAQPGTSPAPPSLPLSTGTAGHTFPFPAPDPSGHGHSLSLILGPTRPTITTTTKYSPPHMTLVFIQKA